VRSYGLLVGIELEPISERPGARAFETFTKCFERGLLTRQSGDVLALSPPLVVERPQIQQMFETLAAVLRGV
jgi:beta-alanine--pyruvate transaminase